MSTCTFFGQRDTPAVVREVLRAVIADLVKKGVTEFYVGNQGAFDAMVRAELRRAQQEFPLLKYAVVLAYLPQKNTVSEDFSDTVYPDGLEQVPRRYAIGWRNRYMINRADYVVTYVRRQGGAAQYKALAERKGKIIITL